MRDKLKNELWKKCVKRDTDRQKMLYRFIKLAAINGRIPPELIRICCGGSEERERFIDTLEQCAERKRVAPSDK